MSLRAVGVSFAYPGAPALEGVSLEARAGEVLGLVGPNGAGKSTLLRVLAGLLRPRRGTVELEGEELSRLKPRQLARKLALVEQTHPLGFDFSVREVVAWGRLPHRGRLDPWRARDERAVRRALRATRLEALAGRPLRALSSGEQQRVFLALALAQEPRILLWDEPTAHLDLKHQQEILALGRDRARRGWTVVVALHDLNLAARTADRLAVLSAGRLAACGAPQAVLSAERIASIWGVQARVVRDAEGVWVFPRALKA